MVYAQGQSEAEGTIKRAICMETLQIQSKAPILFKEEMPMVIDDPKDTFYECDETFEEDRNPSWPFATEDDEHRYFDNLQRAADIRSAQ